jgi:predicted transcriptional regulator
MAESSPPDRISITIEITPEQKRRIEQLAEQRRLSPEAVVRAALDRELRTSSSDAEAPSEGAETGSFLEVTRDLVGSVDGPDVPSDLSHNPEHMEGYGR